MSIIIQNVSKHARPTGLHTYEIRINSDLIATFTHKREDGLAKCLMLAAAAVERAKWEQFKRVIEGAE